MFDISSVICILRLGARLLVTDHATLQQVLAQLLLRNPRDVMFARYSPLNYRVTLKWGVGVTQDHRKCHHSITWYGSLFDFYSNYGRMSHNFRDTPTYWSKITQFLTPCIRRPIRGEVVGVKQRLSVMKH